MKDPKASLRQKASDGPDGAHIECSNCSEAVGRAERRWSCHHPQFRFCLFIELSGLESTSSTCNPVFLPKKRIKQKSESLTLQDPSTKQALVPQSGPCYVLYNLCNEPSEPVVWCCIVHGVFGTLRDES